MGPWYNLLYHECEPVIQRREFLKSGGALAASLPLVVGGPAFIPRGLRRFLEADRKQVADAGLEAARAAGASYADVRISRHRYHNLFSREERIESIGDDQSYGSGVRVLVRGTWGFAAGRSVTSDEAARLARNAVATARVNAAVPHEEVVLAPVAAYTDSWKTPIGRDPFDVPLSEKTALLLAINAAATGAGAAFCSSSFSFQHHSKYYASTDGSYIDQDLYRSYGWFSATAVDRRSGEFQSRATLAQPAGRGYEAVEEWDYVGEAERAGAEAREKLTAPSVEPGRKDLVLAPSHLWLTIHESVGHPTELDRALGYEANLAGTSFLTPDKLGSFRFASPIVSFLADKDQPGALATVGYDDEGVKAEHWHLVKDGVFVDYQTTREQARWIQLSTGIDRSHGTSYAEHWHDVQFQRMPNINLVPDPDGGTAEDLISGVDDGIYLEGNSSYSIDQQRYNFQFSAQLAWEIKGGKRGRLLRDVAYQAITPEFWNACDGLGGPQTYALGGAYYDGKGQPGQTNAVSHGCPPARFRGVNVLNTREKA